MRKIQSTVQNFPLYFCFNFLNINAGRLYTLGEASYFILSTAGGPRGLLKFNHCYNCGLKLSLGNHTYNYGNFKN